MAIPMNVELHGQIVDLLPTKTEDYDSLRLILSDPKTMEHLKYMAHVGEGGWTLQQVRERYEKWTEGQKRQTDLHFTVHDRSTHEVLGSCGFKNINLAHRLAEFGLIIHHPFWGKGVSAECHLLCFEYGFTRLGLHRIEMHTFVTNTRMRKFFEKIGMRQEGIKKECFYHEGTFMDDAGYVLFDREWATVKSELVKRIARQVGS